MTKKQRVKGKYEFFLRFYDQPQKEIDACLSELRKIKGLAQFTTQQEPMTVSMNFPGSYTKGVEVVLLFDLKKDRDAFLAEDQVKVVYHKYATKLPGAGVHLRKPGQVAFGV